MHSDNLLTVGGAWRNSLEKHSDRPFTASIDGLRFTYGEAAAVISRLSAMLIDAGFKKGDRAALISENRAEWGLCWLSITAIGGIAVPVMTDFPSEQINNILEHSGSKFVFASEKMLTRIDKNSHPEIEKIITIDNNPVFNEKTGSERVLSTEPDVLPEDSAALIYTSGTTGNSKGVLLSHRNIMTNTWDSVPVGKFMPGDSMLSVLPLAHMYEFTQGFVLPMATGANVTYLGLKPSPTMLVKALERIRPHYILSVPLLIEKIYRSSVLGPIRKSRILRSIYRVPPLRFMLNRFVIGRKLLKTFGGRLKFFGIGGAPLSSVVERFLRQAKFPYAVGYGLTETSPVLAGSGAFETVYRGIGPAFNSVKLRISDEGEIQASGDSVMSGYYRDEQRTAEAFTDDGWFKTGDLGHIDKKGNLFIKGRLKNLILGPSGENIYPEEIENQLRADPLVAECLVMMTDKQLVAKVFFDEDKLKQQLEELKINWEEFRHNMHAYQAEKEEVLEAMRQKINRSLSGFSRLSRIIEQELPFELTPSLKVKRFLYT